MSHEKPTRGKNQKKGNNYSVFNAAHSVSRRAAKALPGLGMKSFVLVVIVVIVSLAQHIEVAGTKESKVKEVQNVEIEKLENVEKNENKKINLKTKRRLCGRN
eukprot:GHVP01054388.1.p1 GENE.GHVP01054388.1~~GHVP01054388.1.p1  ORF type:complete len:103 (-),score=22.05 GHVP01054388.1:99-407(-)